MNDRRVEESRKMREILESLNLPDTVICKFNEEKVYPATVPHLTDSQLKTLGVTAMGDIVSLREKCHSTVKGDSVRQKVSQVMGYTFHRLPTFPTPKKVLPKMKPKIVSKAAVVPQKKAKESSFDKQLTVFKYMGTSPPKCFSCIPENIVITGMLPSLYPSSSEREIRNEIAELIRAESLDYNGCLPEDFEYIRVSRRSASVPTVKAGFNWDGNAIKGLARQGGVFVRLTRRFTSESADPSDASASSSGDDLAPPARRQRVDSPNVIPQNPIPISSSSDDESLPPAFVSASIISPKLGEPSSSSLSQCPPNKDNIRDMFPSVADTTVNALFELTNGHGEDVAESLLNPPLLSELILRMKSLIDSDNANRLLVDEEDDDGTFFSVLEMYKAPSFNATHNLKVRFRGQPGVDAGGVRRQMFTNVFDHFITSQSIGIFQRGTNGLIIVYSVQNIISGLMVILGRIIAHAIVLEGIGFPYLSKASYWYIVTEDSNIVLPFATLEDVPCGHKEMLTQLLSANTKEEILEIKEDAMNYLSQSGSLSIPSLANKDQIIQDIVFNEVVVKPKPLLDQLVSGLKTLGVLTYIQAYPHQFEPLLVQQKELTPSYVKSKLMKPSSLTTLQTQLWDELNTYLEESSPDELEEFLEFCTASRQLIGKKISVVFKDQAEFHVSTCLRKLTIPDHPVKNFKSVLRALVGKKGKGKPKVTKSFTVV